MRTPALLVALMLAAAPAAAAMHKCKGPNGRTIYSDVPCPATHEVQEIKIWNSRLSGRGVWEFEKRTDEMTGETACLVLSPSTTPEASKNIDFKFVPTQLVIDVTASTSIIGARLAFPKDSFHNDLSGMGIKLDNLEFVPFDVKGGQHVVGTSQSRKILDALPKAREVRLRLRFWPYDALYDTYPIPTTGYTAAIERAQQCAESLARR